MIKFSIFFISILFSINAFAGVKVIAVLGQTTDTEKYFEQLQNDIPNQTQKTSPEKEQQQYYQINSQRLTPGKVTPRYVNIKTLPHPIFIIGDDKRSLTWLDKYIDILKEINAVGFIVNLKNYNNYKAIINEYNITLFPINGDKLAQKFNIKHYPVLISQNKIEQ